MIRVRIKSQLIEFNDLDDDCNYEVNQYPLIQSLSYIQWGDSELRILDKNNMIDWEIYSYNDLSHDIFKLCYNKINLETYLIFMESKYKMITLDQLKNLKLIQLFDCVKHIDDRYIIKHRAESNPEYYYNNSEFLLKFKFAIIFFNYDVILKYINTPELLIGFTQILPLTLFEKLLLKITIPGPMLTNVYNLITEKFANYPYEQLNIINIFFQSQSFSFDFIKSKLYSPASYDTWVNIIKYQKITNAELLLLMYDNKIGKTICNIICQHKYLDMQFIEENSINNNILDINLILTHQPLSYEFVKSHHTKLNLNLLTKNNNIKFTITELNTDGIFHEPQYIIINNISHCDKIIFID